ncbi:hypothetical protein JTB14_022210, partial [Gonioctena quinquepunctata]
DRNAAEAKTILRGDWGSYGDNVDVDESSEGSGSSFHPSNSEEDCDSWPDGNHNGEINIDNDEQ